MFFTNVLNLINALRCNWCAQLHVRRLLSGQIYLLPAQLRHQHIYSLASAAWALFSKQVLNVSMRWWCQAILPSCSVGASYRSNALYVEMHIYNTTHYMNDAVYISHTLLHFRDAISHSARPASSLPRMSYLFAHALYYHYTYYIIHYDYTHYCPRIHVELCSSWLSSTVCE